jgi:NitT/TauT family transport system substrate-binding protein
MHPSDLSRRAFALSGASLAVGLALPSSRAHASTETVGVAMLANLDAGPLLLAEKHGLFRKHGLDATIHPGGNGATIIPTVLSGQYPIGYANVISDLQAIDRGLPLLLVHPAYGQPSDPDKDSYRVYVDPEGPIKNVAQLATARIGGSPGIPDWTTRKSLENLGVKHGKLQWVRVSGDDGISAVKKREIDAVWYSQPSGARAVRAGLVPILSVNANSIPNAVGGYYITSRDFAAANPSILTKFTKGVAEANILATNDPAAVKAVVVERLKFDRDIVEASDLNLYPNDPNIASLRVIAEDCVRYGIIRKLPDFEAIFWQAPT